MRANNNDVVIHLTQVTLALPLVEEDVRPVLLDGLVRGICG
jgi:hypothetical protein